MTVGAPLGDNEGAKDGDEVVGEKEGARVGCAVVIVGLLDVAKCVECVRVCLCAVLPCRKATHMGFVT